MVNIIDIGDLQENDPGVLRLAASSRDNLDQIFSESDQTSFENAFGQSVQSFSSREKNLHEHVHRSSASPSNDLHQKEVEAPPGIITHYTTNNGQQCTIDRG